MTTIQKMGMNMREKPHGPVTRSSRGAWGGVLLAREMSAMAGTEGPPSPIKLAQAEACGYQSWGTGWKACATVFGGDPAGRPSHGIGGGGVGEGVRARQPSAPSPTFLFRSLLSPHPWRRQRGPAGVSVSSMPRAARSLSDLIGGGPGSRHVRASSRARAPGRRFS